MGCARLWTLALFSNRYGNEIRSWYSSRYGNHELTVNVDCPQPLPHLRARRPPPGPAAFHRAGRAGRGVGKLQGSDRGRAGKLEWSGLPCATEPLWKPALPVPQLPSPWQGDAVTQPCLKCCRSPIKCDFGTKTKREKYMFPGSFADISLVQHRGRKLASIHWHQSKFGWILRQMLRDVLPLWFLLLCPRAGFPGEPAICACSAHPSLQGSFPSPPVLPLPLCSYLYPNPGEPWTLSPPHSLHDSPSSSSPSPPASL